MDKNEDVLKGFVLDKKIKAIIFDLDGTIADTMPSHFKAWQKAGEKLGFEYTEEEFYELAGKPSVEIAKILNERKGYSLDPQEVEEVKTNEYLNSEDEIKVFDFTMAVIEKYYDKVPMIIGTGNIKKIAIKTLKDLNILHYFVDVVSCEDVSNFKPHPETFMKCADILNVEYKRCVVFEDGEKGIEAGIEAGMQVVDVREYI